MSLQAVIDKARADLGYTESPPNSNMTKYGEWYGMNGQPWCVMALAYWFNSAGERMAFYNGAKTASCTALMQLYKAEGRWHTDGQYQCGDIAIMTFAKNREVQHCGLIIGKAEDGGWITVEGNTSPGVEGSQNNGGCVAQKIRFNSNILGVCRPKYQKEEEPMNDWEHIQWASKEIRWNMDNKIMTGYPDGSFKPGNAVTRAEQAVMNYRMYAMLEEEIAELRREIARLK